MEIIIAIYLSIVIGGWVGLKPAQATPTNFAYQIPTNTFFEIDRSVRDIFRKPDERRETLSSWAHRTNSNWKYVANIYITKVVYSELSTFVKYIIAKYVFNTLMLDPEHCERYSGL